MKKPNGTLRLYTFEVNQGAQKFYKLRSLSTPIFSPLATCNPSRDRGYTTYGQKAPSIVRCDLDPETR